jgi:hypothetical protein
VRRVNKYPMSHSTCTAVCPRCAISVEWGFISTTSAHMLASDTADQLQKLLTNCKDTSCLPSLAGGDTGAVLVWASPGMGH